MYKSELLDQVARSRARLEKMVGQLSAAQVTRPGRDGWRIQDHLAHLATWELGIAALLRRQPRYRAMGEGVEEAERAGSGTETINNLIYRQHKDKSWVQVMDCFREAHQQLLDALAPLSDTDLQKSYSHFQPDEPGDDDARPIRNWIVGNTYEHYAEHEAWIKEMTT